MRLEEMKLGRRLKMENAGRQSKLITQRSMGKLAAKEKVDEMQQTDLQIAERTEEKDLDGEQRGVSRFEWKSKARLYIDGNEQHQS